MANLKASQQAQMEAHVVKTTRMEAAKAQSDYGGGISAKIEEGIEPSDE